MKLCIVTHNIIKGDGQGRVNYEVTKEAIRRGHHLTLVATQVAAELQQSSQVNWVKIPVERWSARLLRDMAFSRQSANWLGKNRHDFDVVKVNGAITAAEGDVNAVHFLHSSWLRSPVHVSRLRHDFYGFYQWLYTALNAQWEKKAFRQAKVVVAVSEKIGKDLIEIGVPPSQIRIIVNGVDLQEFSPGHADRKELSLPEQVPLALFVGEIRTPRKNLDTVLHALTQVPDLHLVVVGNTDGSPYPQIAAQLKLATRVHFLGYRRDVARIMQAVDLFVFPSRYEACTLVLLEAMASGLPAITATSTGGAELVTPECGVVLPDSDDVNALAEALCTLTKEPAQRQKMGQAARTVAEQHSWNKMAQNYVDLFEELSQ